MPIIEVKALVQPNTALVSIIAVCTDRHRMVAANLLLDEGSGIPPALDYSMPLPQLPKFTPAEIQTFGVKQIRARYKRKDGKYIGRRGRKISRI